MTALARYNDPSRTIGNQAGDAKARPWPKNCHRGARGRAPAAERSQILFLQMRQGQRGRLEIVDDPNSSELELATQLASVDDPGAVAENGAFVLHRPCNSEHGMRDISLANL